MAKEKNGKVSTEPASLAEVLNALGDPVRLAIVKHIAQKGETPCGAFEIDRPKSTLSHHFRVLRQSGVLGSRPEGTALMNFLLTEPLNRRFPGLLDSILNNLG